MATKNTVLAAIAVIAAIAVAVVFAVRNQPTAPASPAAAPQAQLPVSEPATLLPPPTSQAPSAVQETPAEVKVAPVEAQEAPAKQRKPSAEPQESRAKAIITAKCSRCHAPGPALAFRGPRDQVGPMVDNMNVQGAGLTDEEAAVVVDYLSR